MYGIVTATLSLTELIYTHVFMSKDLYTVTDLKNKGITSSKVL